MGWFLYGAALIHAWQGRENGFDTIHGAANLVTAAILMTGGAIVLAINDLRKRNP